MPQDKGQRARAENVGQRQDPQPQPPPPTDPGQGKTYTNKARWQSRRYENHDDFRWSHISRKLADRDIWKRDVKYA